YGAGTTATYNDSTGVLTVTDANGDHVSLTIGTGYDNAHFAGGTDGHGGTLITLNENDDAPSFTQSSSSGSVSELADKTRLSTSETPPGTLTSTDIGWTARPTVSIEQVTGQSVVWKDGTADLSGSLTQDQIT